MKIPALIFSAFLITSFVILVSNKPDPPKNRRAIALEKAHQHPMTSIVWLDSTQQLGTIKEGEIRTINFRFKNTGQKMLVIGEVAASCGCTVPEKPEKPIAPGEEGVILARFDSDGRIGTNHKVISVFANTENAPHQLSFDVEVIKTP
jgi:hypothetical protein